MVGVSRRTVMSPRLAILLAAALVVVSPAPSRAAFHLAHIFELMSGVNGNPAVQYVEIRMDAIGQNAVGSSRLTAFNCDGTSSTVLLLVPSNIARSGVDVRWTMATTGFAAASGLTPDFTWDPTSTGNVDPTCGMVCWGAPGLVPPPPTWDATDPNNYVDCVGYGGYSGPTKTSTHDGTPTSGTPTGLRPGNGTMSLTRVGFSGNNVADFALDCPVPQNNAGMSGTFGPCAPPTTTTTTSTTTTTLPQKSKCTSKEFAAAGKKASAEAKCYSKVVAKNDTSGLAGCLTTATGKFTAAYAKAVGSGDCLTSATAGTVESEVDSFTSGLNTTLTGGSSGPSKCTSKELSAAGSKAGGKAKCYAKAASKNDTSLIAGCLTAVETKFGKAFDKATAAGGCINGTNVDIVESRVDSFISGLKGSLAPAFP
jgi:hypothetical protein